jgi:hypothetical protein
LPSSRLRSWLGLGCVRSSWREPTHR